MARKSYSAITLGAFQGRVMRCFNLPPGTKIRGKSQQKICMAASRGKSTTHLSTSSHMVEPYKTKSGRKVKGQRRKGGWIVSRSLPRGMKTPRSRWKPKSTPRRKAARSKFSTAAKRCGRRGLTRREFNSCVKNYIRTGTLSTMANKYVQQARSKSKGRKRGRSLSGLSGASKRKPKCLKWGKPAKKGGKRRCMKRAKR